MATSLVTRETAGGGASVKDAPLTNAEVDNNFITLADNKLEASSNLGDLTDTAAAKTNLDLATMAEQESNNVSITGGTITGITNLEATGGTITGITNLEATGGTITGITNLEATGGDLSGVTISSSTINNDITGTATNVSSSLSTGDGLSGSSFDGSSSVTFSVDGTVARNNSNQTISGTFEVDSLGVNTTAPTTAGEIRATGDVVAHFSSDIKNKENVTDISNALSTVSSIGGKTFDWKDEYINSRGGEDAYFVQKHDFGVIAQDVQKVFPLAVRERENGELAVDYVKLCSLAFAAIKELNEKVDSLITQQGNT